MARKSLAALNVVTPLAGGGRLRPHPGVSNAIVEAFNAIVGTMPKEHFRSCDAPLVEQYAQAIVQSREAYEHLSREGQVIAGRVSPWVTVQEKAHRMMSALCMRLRLAPQARMRVEKAGRMKGRPPNVM